MQNDSPKRKSQHAAAGHRKSGRTVFDKSGRGLWEWQTATGVFEKEISDEQLARLEASQLTLLDSPPSAPVASYYEWCESSKRTPAKQPEKVASQDPPRGALARFFKRLAKKS